MNNKVLVKLIVPEINQVYDVYLPVTKRIGSVLKLLNTAIKDISNDEYPILNQLMLYNADTNAYYNVNDLIINTDIRNGTKLVFIS